MGRFSVDGTDQLQMYIFHSSSLKVNVSFQNMYYRVHQYPLLPLVSARAGRQNQLITRRFKAQCLCGITEFSECKTV